ncbi:MAG: hypothetical protein WCI97_03640 [Bacteroidota bacterium]
MNTNDLNNTTMIGTTISYCELKAAMTAAIAAYATLVSTAKTKLTLINNLNIIASGTTTGVTLDTKITRSNMETLTEKLCNGLLALGGSTNDNTMIAAANYTFAKLEKLAKDDVDDVCEKIVALATANKIALVPMGIVAADITDADTAVGIYRTSMNNPRQTKIDIKTANEKIHPIIRDIIDNIFVKQLDKLTNTLKTSNDEYFSGYYSAREVIDLGHGTTRIKGAVSVKDSSPIKPVYPALIKITNGTDTYVIKNDLTGVFTEQIKRGTYTGTCECVGFDTFTIEPFLVKQGSTVELLIAMTLTV